MIDQIKRVFINQLIPGLICLLFFSFCDRLKEENNSNQKTNTKENITHKHLEEKDLIAEEPTEISKTSNDSAKDIYQDTINKIVENFDQNLNEINRNADSLLRNLMDRSVSKLIDTLKYTYLKTGNVKYLNTLNILCENGDGYVGTHFSSTLHDLLKKEFIDYLFKNKKTCLEDMFIWSLKIEIEYVVNTKKKEIIDSLKNIAKANKFSKEKSHYVDSLIYKLDKAVSE